jgi:hypothetical protein
MNRAGIKFYSGDQIVSRLPPLPPHSLHNTVPKPLQSEQVFHPGETLPLPPHRKQVFLPLLQNVHFFHTCLLDMIYCYQIALTMDILLSIAFSSWGRQPKGHSFFAFA